MIDRNFTKKNLLLSGFGIALQTAGSICLLAATVGIGKEINSQIKKTILQELNKQLTEE